MSDKSGESKPRGEKGQKLWVGPKSRWVPVMVLVFVAVGAAGLTWLLTNIFDRQQEAKSPYNQVVALDENTHDPEVWGKNFPKQYEGFKKTSEMNPDKTEPREPTKDDPRTEIAVSKIEEDPRLVTMWKGYAFSVDYRRPRGHEYMLEDQQLTKRMTEFEQPGACLNCHASLPEVTDSLGDGDHAKGWAEMNKLPYDEAVEHAGGPIGCIDCHDPETMELRITRPAFEEGIAKYKESQGIKDFDVNTDATHQEMRTFVCAQCHVEYYMTPEDKTLTFPWDNGLTVNDAIDYYDEHEFSDFEHEKTGANVIKAQHPEFETWSNGTHAQNGVTCADCHMPYKRDGAAKISEHQVTNPMRTDEGINSSCLTCHNATEDEMRERVGTITGRWQESKDMSFDALDALIADLDEAVKDGRSDEELKLAREYQRRAQFIIDYSVSENSHGFHAPQYSITILNQATDYARKGQLALHGVDVDAGPVATTAKVNQP